MCIRDRQLVELLMCISTRRWCILFQNTRAKSEYGQFWCLQKSSKINWLPLTSLGLLRYFYVSFIIPIHASTKAEMLVKICSVVVEIFDEIWRFFAISFQKYKFLTPQFLALLDHHICTRCRGIICAIHLLIHIAIFNSVLKCQAAEWRSLCKFCPKSVAMATSIKE